MGIRKICRLESHSACRMVGAAATAAGLARYFLYGARRRHSVAIPKVILYMEPVACFICYIAMQWHALHML